jgi:hypothetical protein
MSLVSLSSARSLRSPRSSNASNSSRTLGAPKVSSTKLIEEALKQASLENAPNTVTKLLQESRSIGKKFPGLHLLVICNESSPNNASFSSLKLAKNHVIIYLGDGHIICSEDANDQMMDIEWKSDNHMQAFQKIKEHYSSRNIKNMAALLRGPNLKLAERQFRETPIKSLLPHYQANSLILPVLQANLGIDKIDFEHTLVLLDNNPVAPRLSLGQALFTALI